MSNRTFTIVKPDSVRKGNFGKIISRLEAEGFKVLGLKKVGLSRAQAEGFYAVHKERPFYTSLVEYMTSGPVFVAALERDNAVTAWRDCMGATDPAKAAPGSIRKQFGSNVGENATHGSDSLDNAKREIAYFFPGAEVQP